VKNGEIMDKSKEEVAYQKKWQTRGKCRRSGTEVTGSEQSIKHKVEEEAVNQWQLNQWFVNWLVGGIKFGFK
jgi:hypothetical protein